MPALIALVYMAAKGGRAAVANRGEGLLLVRTQYVSPLREEILFVGAENIGHFQPMLVHRLRRMVWTKVIGSNSSRGLVVVRTATSATCR